MDLRQKFESQMDERIAEKSAHVAGGSCQTQEAYREAVGYIKGLKSAKEDFQELWKQLE